MRVTREDLYREVWTEPMTTVAMRYSVSSNYLARVCKQLKIPHPSRGYWQQLEAGIKVERSALPEPGPGDALEWTRNGEEPARVSMSANAPRNRTKKERGEKHPLLVGARELFDHAREPNSSPFDKREASARYVRPWKRTIVDIHVTHGQLDRALKVASELFNALEDRGMEVRLAPPHGYCHKRHEILEQPTESPPYDLSHELWSPGVPTLVLVADVAFGITLFETAEIADMKRVGDDWVRVARPQPKKSSFRSWEDRTSQRWMPTGRFGVHAYAANANVAWDSYWREAKPGGLASMYPRIATALEEAVPRARELLSEEKARQEEWARTRKAEQEEWARRQEEERRRQEEQRLREEETRRGRELEQVIGHWRLARDIREYVRETETLVKSANLKGDGRLEHHLSWALAYADRVDPLRDLRAEIAKTVADHDQRCGRTDGQHREPEPSEPRDPSAT